MNLWAIIALVLLALLVPVMAFGLGILVGHQDSTPDDHTKDIVGGWIVGTIGLSVTLANIILALS
jgi:hypothetical protein